VGGSARVRPDLERGNSEVICELTGSSKGVGGESTGVGWRGGRSTGGPAAVLGGTPPCPFVWRPSWESLATEEGGAARR
jgi:hypothetical protein